MEQRRSTLLESESRGVFLDKGEVFVSPFSVQQTYFSFEVF